MRTHGRGGDRERLARILGSLAALPPVAPLGAPSGPRLRLRTALAIVALFGVLFSLIVAAGKAQAVLRSRLDRTYHEGQARRNRKMAEIIDASAREAREQAARGRPSAGRGGQELTPAQWSRLAARREREAAVHRSSAGQHARQARAAGE